MSLEQCSDTGMRLSISTDIYKSDPTLEKYVWHHTGVWSAFAIQPSGTLQRHPTVDWAYPFTLILAPLDSRPFVFLSVPTRP